MGNVVPVTIATIQTFHGQSCSNDQSGMDNRNDRQQCNIGNNCAPEWIKSEPSQINQCFGTNQQDGGGDGFGPGAGFLKPRLSRPTYEQAGHPNGIHNGEQEFGGRPNAVQLKNDAQQFYIALENGAQHSQVENMEVQPEMVGWAAFTPHHGSMGEFTYEAGNTPLAVTEQPYHISYKGFFRAAPKFYANIATYHGGDSSELRRAEQELMDRGNIEGCDILIEEETCMGEAAGAYTHPNAESVAYVAMLAGFGSSADTDSGGIRARPVVQPGHTPLAGAGSHTVLCRHANPQPPPWQLTSQVINAILTKPGNHIAMAETGDVTLTSGACWAAGSCITATL